MNLTRRSLLQVLGITIGAAVIPAHLDVEPSTDEPIDVEQPLASPTRLERFIRSHGIKPAHLARESGYSRQHLLRLRFGRMRPSLTCIAALVIALRRLTNKRVTAEDLCEPNDIEAAWQEARGQRFEDHEPEELRAAFVDECCARSSTEHRHDERASRGIQTRLRSSGAIMSAAVDAQHIRELFLQRKPSYGLSEAGRLLGMTRKQLEREARADQEEAYRVNGHWRFTWRQVAYLAFRRWSLAKIHEALGSDAGGVLPPLLALRTITVRLPEYLVRAMEHSATSEDTTIDDWLHHELVDFAGTVANRIERVIPGFRRAYLFPGQESAR